MNQKNYQLIAFDMDGTLLDSHKKISKKTIQAIDEAVTAGKIVILNTGRCPAELREYMDELSGVRYLNCISGALVYDRGSKEEGPGVIFSKTIDKASINQLLLIASLEDTFVQLLTDQSYVEGSKICQMEKYGMGVYQDMYEAVTTKMTDMKKEYEKAPFPVSKMNIYHTSPEARERTRERVLAAGIEGQLANAELTSLEISPRDIHKGIGLKRLCDHLGIGLSETIAVGDADNDLLALESAGLAIAMANANENVKKICPVTVADNDHDGCAEAIYHYLLNLQ